jgi:DNA-binding winged helix-turn-helix (wHTH) protein/TolB-like protein
MSAPRFRFGLFDFTPSALELRRDGKLIRLQSQPAQALACLLAHADEIVSREDLRSAVWGTDTHVDFDRGLNFCIAQLRSALDDDTVSPRFIRTHPRRGYQFIAPVQRIESPSDCRGVPSGRPCNSDPIAPLSVSNAPPRRKFSATTLTLACAATALLILTLGSAYLLAARHIGKSHPTIAIVRFDNETSDGSLKSFSDAITDTLVEQLTTQSLNRYEVIGNAAILRLPRDQRDLSAIASSLHANYVILGQVQSAPNQGDGAKNRILAHLIRLPDQTHIWVDRLDRSLTDPLATESEAAQKIASDFSQRIVADSTGPRLPQFGSH